MSIEVKALEQQHVTVSIDTQTFIPVKALPETDAIQVTMTNN